VPAPALEPRRFVRSLAASASTLGKTHVKLLSLVDRVNRLTRDAPYAVLGGVAQILWAKKTHTDDLDVAVASEAWERAVERVRRRLAPRGWRLPDRAVESDEVFEVAHVTYRGSVVDLLCFHDKAFMREVLVTAQVVPGVGRYRFIRPELLLVTHLLRPRVEAALAAVELVLARRAAGDFDEDYAARWAGHMGHATEFARTLARAAEMQSG
jgi:hypothetical protein